MEQKYFDLLKKQEHPDKILKLRDHIVDLVKTSRGVMSKKYKNWDRNQDIYKGIRPPDEEDEKANRDQEPEKMVVPLSYAQIQTFVAFTFLLMTQGKYFFSLDPSGNEDYGYRASSERTLQRDLTRNQWSIKLYQVLLDIGRFGLAVTNTSWETQKVKVPKVSSDNGNLDLTYGEADPVVERIKYQGNKIRNISPYRWFPDTRRPLTEWMDGKFCADEMEKDRKWLKQEEKSKGVSGIEFVGDMGQEALDNRKGTRQPGIVQGAKNSTSRKAEGLVEESKQKLVLITQCQAWLIPADWDLGVETYEVLFLVWIANDDRIVRVDKLGYAHQEFTYDMSQFSPDEHQELTESLSDVLFNIQDVISWLINSRVVAVRRGIDGKLVADPDAFDAESFENSESPVVWLKSGAPKLGGVGQHFGQLQYSDPTQSNFNDSQFMSQLAQSVTGINENAMGQFSGGRRSATEARAVTSGSAGRLKLVGSMVFESHFNPMGRKMLSNQRQGMTFEVFKKILGEKVESDPMTGETVDKVKEDYAMFHPADSSELVGSEDFFVMDSTLESEKGFIAQSLQELLQALMANPEAAQAFNINPKALLDEIMELRGVGDLSRFSNATQPDPNNIVPENVGQNNTDGLDSTIQSPAGV